MVLLMGALKFCQIAVSLSTVGTFQQSHGWPGKSGLPPPHPPLSVEGTATHSTL